MEMSFQTTIMHIDTAKISVKYASYDKNILGFTRCQID